MAGDLSPAEARSQRIASYHRLSRAELGRVHAEQIRRLRAARIEERAIVTRWTEVHHVVDTLSVTTGEIEQVLLEKGSEASWMTNRA